MSRSLVIGATAIAAAALMPQTPAMAEYPDGSILVVSPPAPRVEPKDGVRRPVQFIAQVTVPTHDLNLRSPYGRLVLERRVEIAAAEACSRLEGVYSGVGAVEADYSSDCRLGAVKHARDQVRAAILADG